MKKLFENWRYYLEEADLDESLMLKKDRFARKEGRENRSWPLYAKFVAEAYAKASNDAQGLTPKYVKLGKWLEGTYGRITSKVEIVFTPEHVYKSAKGMRDRVAKEGKIYVSTSDAEHPVWTGKQGLIWNTYFRAWHDWEGHIAKKKAFSLQGEIAAYNGHVGASGPPRECIPIIFTEVVGQICCFYNNKVNTEKVNCEQKAVVLDEWFDPIRVGMLTPAGEQRFGYRTDTNLKLLVPIGSEGEESTSDKP